MTPEMLKAWQQGKLDSRCRQCGETYPARRLCIKCGARDMEYRLHIPGPRVGPGAVQPTQWCQQGAAPKIPDPSDPRTGVLRGPRKVSRSGNATEGVAAVT